MSQLRDRILKVLLIISVGILPAGAIDCDLDDGELEIDFGDWGYSDDCYYDCGGGFYYEEYYDPWYGDWW